MKIEIDLKLAEDLAEYLWECEDIDSIMVNAFESRESWCGTCNFCKLYTTLSEDRKSSYYGKIEEMNVYIRSKHE